MFCRYDMSVAPFNINISWFLFHTQIQVNSVVKYCVIDSCVQLLRHVVASGLCIFVFCIQNTVLFILTGIFENHFVI